MKILRVAGWQGEWTEDGRMTGGKGARVINPNAAFVLEKGYPGATDPMHRGPYAKAEWSPRYTDATKQSRRLRFPMEENPNSDGGPF